MKKYPLVVILSITAYYLPAHAASAEITNLIRLVSYFVSNTQQLDLLKDQLSQHKEASIVGSSSISKTQLARNYADQNQHQYDLV